MSTYVILGNFTQQGVQTVKDFGARVDAASEVLQGMGIKMTSLLYTMGQYDVVGVFEAPDDETLMKGLLAIAGAGNVRTETLRCFTEEEFRTITAALP